MRLLGRIAQVVRIRSAELLMSTKFMCGQPTDRSVGFLTGGRYVDRWSTYRPVGRLLGADGPRAQSLILDPRIVFLINPYIWVFFCLEKGIRIFGISEISAK